MSKFENEAKKEDLNKKTKRYIKKNKTYIPPYKLK